MTTETTNALINTLLNALFCSIQDGDPTEAEAYLANLTNLFPDVSFSNEQQERYDWMALHIHNTHVEECGNARCARCAA
jgi:hypothetical protein